MLLYLVIKNKLRLETDLKIEIVLEIYCVRYMVDKKAEILSLFQEKNMIRSVES